jgi:hypothetical protein
MNSTFKQYPKPHIVHYTHHLVESLMMSQKSLYSRASMKHLTHRRQLPNQVLKLVIQLICRPYLGHQAHGREDVHPSIHTVMIIGIPADPALKPRVALWRPE